MRRFSYAYQFFDYSTVDRIRHHESDSVLMYLGFLISTVGYDKVIQMLKQIQSVKEEKKNE